MPKRVSALRQNQLPIIEINRCHPCESFDHESPLNNLSLENKFGIKLNNLNSFDLERFFDDLLKSDNCLINLNVLMIDSDLNNITLERLSQILPSLPWLRQLDLISLRTDELFSKFIRFLSQQSFQKKINFIHNSKNKKINNDDQLSIICADNLDFNSLDYYKFIYKQLSYNPISIRSEKINKNLGNLPLLHMNFSGINFNKNIANNQVNQGLRSLPILQNPIVKSAANFENNKSISSDLEKNISKVRSNNHLEFFAKKCATEFAENIPLERFKLLNNIQIKHFSN